MFSLPVTEFGCNRTIYSRRLAALVLRSLERSVSKVMAELSRLEGLVAPWVVSGRCTVVVIGLPARHGMGASFYAPPFAHPQIFGTYIDSG